MDTSYTTSRRLILSVVTTALLLAGSIALSSASIDFQRFSAYGYLGVFIATLIGSATLFFPVPNVATVFVGGILFNPFGVALASGLGSTIGETVGYYFGVSGEPLVSNSKWHGIITDWIRQYGGGAVFLFALIPNPLFDIVGLVSGFTHYPFFRFLMATFLGKTIRSLIIAYLGAVTN